MKSKAYVMGGISMLCLVTSLPACTSIFSNAAKVEIRPVLQATDDPSGNGFYEFAIGAINRRDYASALDYLQAAREKNPRNVKVINAFGVIYDKLGRFDLSARYYQQALAIEPKSEIVAANMSYSRMLQNVLDPRPTPSQLASLSGQLVKPTLQAEASISNLATAKQEESRAGDLSPLLPHSDMASSELRPAQPAALIDANSPAIALAPASPSSQTAPPDRMPASTVVAASVPLPTEQAASKTSASSSPSRPSNFPGIISKATSKALILTGHPLQIVNASGKRGAIDAVHRNLAALGWTLSRSATVAAQTASYSTLLYPKANFNAARGLARTLPFPVRLTVNTCDCGGLALVIGNDTRDWKAGRKIGPAMLAASSVVALSGAEHKGVRQ